MTDERNMPPGDGEEPRPEESPEAPEAAGDAAETATATQTIAVPPPPPAGAVPSRRLTRRPEGKMIAGVCAGIAAYFGVDPVMVRIGFVIATLLTGGTVLLAYIVCWVVMPMAAEGEPLHAPPSTDWGNATQWVAIGAILLGGFLLFRNIFDFRPGIFWGLLLVGVGVAMWGRGLVFGSRNGNGGSHPKAAGDVSSGPLDTSASSVAAPPPPPPTTTGFAAGAAAPAPSPTRREPSILGRLVVGASALAIGVGVLLDNLGVVRMSPKAMVMVLLLIVGAGLLIGTVWGRARWLVFPGIVLACVLGTLSLTPNFPVSAGERLWRPSSLSEVRHEYSLGAGELVLDLSKVRFAGHRRNVEANVGFGQIIVIVPDAPTVRVDASVGGGNTDLFHRASDGVGVDQQVRSAGRREGYLRFAANVGFGEIIVRRASDAADVQHQLRRHNVRIQLFNQPDVRVPGIRVDTNGLPGVRIDTDTNGGDR